MTVFSPTGRRGTISRVLGRRSRESFVRLGEEHRRQACQSAVVAGLLSSRRGRRYGCGTRTRYQWSSPKRRSRAASLFLEPGGVEVYRLVGRDADLRLVGREPRRKDAASMTSPTTSSGSVLLRGRVPGRRGVGRSLCGRATGHHHFRRGRCSRRRPCRRANPPLLRLYPGTLP